MANNSIVTSNKPSITVDGAKALIDSVKDGLKLVSQGYLAVTPMVAKLYDTKAHKALGYRNFDELCTMEFAMSHGTSVGIRKVFEKFGDIDKDNKYFIPEKYLKYGYTKLLLFTDKNFEKSGIDPIEKFTPEMTIADMKSVLASALEDKAKSQDESAIDTESTESEKSIIDNSESTESTESTESEKIEVKTDKAIIEDTIVTIKSLKLTMDYLKPEKKALLDAIEANLKELKKLAK